MDYDGRDIKDLGRTDIAVYNFRGYTVLRFDKKKKKLDIGDNANMCCFINNDLIGMSEFLANCHKFAIGELADVTHVEVN